MRSSREEKAGLAAVADGREKRQAKRTGRITGFPAERVENRAV
jgi:hypothetical protein